MRYWVVVIHQTGHMPRFISDPDGDPFTFDDPGEAKDAIVRWWVRNKNASAKYDPAVLRMTVVRLED